MPWFGDPAVTQMGPSCLVSYVAMVGCVRLEEDKALEARGPKTERGVKEKLRLVPGVELVELWRLTHD